MSKLLINENPLIVTPSLAMKIGLNEAIIMQQIHYWASASDHVIEGRQWIFNTYKDWQKQFPFWSESTIKRTFYSLEKRGLVISGNWNRFKLDKTKWYTIDYSRLQEITDTEQALPESAPNTTATTEEEPSSWPTEPHTQLVLESGCEQNEPEGETEWSKAETSFIETKPKRVQERNIPVAEVINYLNEKTNASFRASSNRTQQLVRARAKEGFTLENFKKVIDIKAAEWLADPRMSPYLRPETLFGTKFESYLNQKPFKKTLK
ncbi:conserved phage C-terminal domain-containing protein [Bacillus sp. FJAT-29953]|nr:conserved phage C-terminal domain-containing protein [Bacillus sp. FJAT-29953]